MNDPKKPLDRFHHLERERGGPLEEKVGPASAARFGAVEQSPAAPAHEAVPASVRRFDAAQGPDEVLVELNSDDEQPFVKCAACGTEAGKFAQRCPICNASFDTLEQREFNARVWAERKAQLQAERDQSHAREEELLDRAKLDADQRHEMGVAMAKEIGEQYRERQLIDVLTPGRSVDLGIFGRSPLLGLLGFLPQPWSWLVGISLALVPMAFLKFGDRGGTLFYAGAVWLFVDAVLLVPPSFWLRSRYNRWDGW